MKRSVDHILLGCVADDFTGASDAASFLANQGLKTVLFNGIPRSPAAVRDCAAVVIALKTRSIPARQAAEETLAALNWLRSQGAEQLYIKYCSTFDSTPQGNIGPDIDIALEQLGLPYTVICPALPVNGRLVKDGVLIVDGKPIAEGHMANHPLNPIWASELAELMRPQGKYPCLNINAGLLRQPAEHIRSVVREFGAQHPHFYVIPDYADDADGRKIAEVFGGDPLLTGGSGLLEHLANRFKEQYDCAAGQALPTPVSGKGILLSGSCSNATAAQCRRYAASGPSIPLYPARIAGGEQTEQRLWAQIAQADRPVLAYSAGATDQSSRVYPDAQSAERAAKLLEDTISTLALRARDAGYTKIIVAGGETSGAVALKLGYDAFYIGESVAPGVPVMIPVQDQTVRIVLKSGNFGQEDFFARALNMVGGDDSYGA